MAVTADFDTFQLLTLIRNISETNMATLRYVFVCFCWWSLVKSDDLQENLSNKSESHSSEISAVLNHLNSSPFKVYNYNKATLLNAQTKADIIELILDINVDCINKYPNVPCGEKIVTCHAFVRNTPEEGSKVLTDVNCKPKPEIIVDEPMYDSPTNPTEVNTNEPTPIVLSNEAVSSEVGEHFVAVRKDSVPCLGCPFDLNTNAEGVDELIDVALEHIETERAKKQALVKVLRLQQQVVTGVKYILTAEFAPTLCEKNVNLDSSSCSRDTNVGTTICEITYLHKPWISKAKHVIKNNCTVSQEYVRPDTRKSDISNEIDVSGKRTKLIDSPNFDKMAENGAIDEMTPSRLADLESQIIVDVEPEIVAPSTVESHPQVESKLEFDLFQRPESLTVSEDPAFTANVTMEESAPTEEETLRVKRDESSEETKKDSSSESVETVANQTKASSSEENSSEEVLRPRRAIRQLEKISPDEKSLVKNLADFAANALDSIDDDNNKRIILQILGAKKMVGDDGVYYHIIMRMGVSRCLEDSPINPYENCKDKLFENYTKICKVQVYVNDDFGSKKVVKSQCQNIKRDKNDNNRTNYSRYKRDGLGAPNRIDKNSEKIRQFVKEGINGFNANYNSKNNKVKPVEVVSATIQVVAGTLYKITTKISESDCSKNDNKDLDDCNILEGASPKTCELEVWEKLWENFRQFTIKCKGDEQNMKFQTSPNNRAKRQAPGGESPVTEDNEYVVKYLEAALNQLDAESPHENKFKVHEFISATSQTVSGHIYRIKTKVVLSDCKKTVSTERGQCGTLKDAKPKTCNFEVFEQTWVPNSRRIKTDCDKERRKRQTLTGGIEEVDKDNDEVKAFVREGILNLNTHLTTNNKVKPVEVVSASVQVVAGTSHRIKLKISESDCSRNDQKDFEQCNVLKGASPKLCEMEVWDKPWENFRRYTIKCEGENKQHQFVLNPNKRTKRQIPGGESPVAEDSEYVIKYLEAALSQLDAESPHENKFKVHEFISATSQTVSGHIYRIKTKVVLSDCKKTVSTERGQCGTLKDAKPKTCKFEVFEQSWVPNSRRIKTDCDKERRKRQTLEGGIKEVDKDNDEVKTFVREGILNLNTHLTTNNKVKPVEVVSATVQVVAGTSHRIKVKISESDCSRNDQKDFEQCNVLEGASPKLCEMEVWDKPWENFRRYTIKCEGDNKQHQFVLNPNKRTKRQILGGESPVAKDDEYVVKYLEAALSQLDAESEHENKFKVHEFISATSQTVSGHIYRINAKVILSDCKKTISTERGQCGTLKDAKPKTCKFEVLEQTWVPKSRQIKTDCDKDRRKRKTLAGGIKEVDKDNDEVKTFVREGLLNLNTHLTTSNKVKPVEVVSATVQVVAGTLHRIKVKISESDCSRNDQKDFEQCNVLEGASPKLCEIEVWDKPWEDFRRYTIKCEGENKQHQFVLNPNKRTKRQILGGESPVAKDDEYVVKYLEAALSQLDAESEHENKFKVHEFISATSQTVSGHIYRINAKVILSDCKKTISTERGQCGTLKDAKPKTCKFEVFEQLWVPNSRQIKSDCDGKRVKRQRSDKPHTVRSKRQSIPGGATEIDKRSDKVKQYVRESLTHLNTQLTSSNKVKPVEVLSATSQVVAGTVHRIKIKISESDCSKDDEKDFDECNIREGASPKICEVKVWDKPWQNFRQYNITCEGEDHHYTFETKPGKTKRSAELDNLLGRDDREYHLSLFTDFLKKYNKKYHKKEYKYRFNVFVQNLMQIRVLNTFEQGTATYGITRFADMTQKEFSRSLGLRTDLRNENETPFAQAKIPDIELPKEFDWRKKKVVTEVKNQEQCGSCWAFSVTGNVEGQYALKHGKLLEFSEQELVDCDTDDQGCNGGLMDTAYRSIEKMGGLETEQDYPYDAEDEKCHFNRTLARVQVTGALNISHNETDMAKWLVANGPISIAINANAMQFYMGGVSHPFKFLCSPKNLDHGVLIVGYGVHNYPLFKKSLPYWIVKNSWGTGWGEQGYYRVYRGDGTCGLNQTPSSAIVA